MSQYGIHFILLLDILSCAFAMLTMLVVNFPEIHQLSTNKNDQNSTNNNDTNTNNYNNTGKHSDNQSTSKNLGKIVGQLSFGWTFIATRRGLLDLLLLFTFSNLISTYIFELVPP